MNPQHSTLEHIRHDETAGALHRDYDTIAAELDTEASAPQAVPDESPQVLYDSSLPEAKGNEESNKERAPSLYTIKSAPRWLWIIIALIVTAAIAVGVAVGIWRHHEHSSYNASHKSSPTISPPISQNRSILPTRQSILNDTSLVAVSENDGTRYLFFQDPTGLIRGAVRTDDQWNTSLNLGIDSNAKNHTPLAATASRAGNFVIELYYVSEGHVLNSSSYYTGSWSPRTQPGSLSSGNFSTTVNTRSLSAASTGIAYRGNASITDQSLLLYEDPTGKVSALCLVIGVVQGKTIDAWVDITSQESQSLLDEFRNNPTSTAEGYSKTLSESLGTNVSTLSTPFSCIIENSTEAAELGTLYSIFYSSNASNSEFLSNEYSTFPSGAGNFSRMSPPMNQESTAIANDSSIHQSDIALLDNFAIWINDTQPVIVTLDNYTNATPPDTAFPFTRLASITSSAFCYLYHQINGTTFAEEQWDNALGNWTATEYISIPYY